MRLPALKKGLGANHKQRSQHVSARPLCRDTRWTAKLLREKVEAEGVQCWLLNAGWTGGKPGVGKRFPKGNPSTSTSALNGTLDNAPTRQADIFGFTAVTACAGVDNQLMNPRDADDPAAYDAAASDLWQQFKANFTKFEDVADDDVKVLVTDA